MFSENHKIYFIWLSGLLASNVDLKQQVSELSCWFFLLKLPVCSRCHSFGILSKKFCPAQLRAHLCWDRSALLWVSTALWDICHLHEKTSTAFCGPNFPLQSGFNLSCHFASILQGVKQWICQLAVNV